MRVVAGVAAGLLLATLPFLHYAHWGGRGAHADHEPRHGGQLGMSGDYHVELRRTGSAVEAFVSDAWRRPLRPRRGWLVFDRGRTAPLAWDGDRLVAAEPAPAREIEAVLILEDDTRVAVSFDFSPPATPGH